MISRKKPIKHSDNEISEAIKKAIDADTYIITKHALERMAERKISITAIKEVLTDGYREKKKDEWNEEFKSWNYAMRLNKSENFMDTIRICINMDVEGLVIVTVMWVGK